MLPYPSSEAVTVVGVSSPKRSLRFRAISSAALCRSECSLDSRLSNRLFEEEGGGREGGPIKLLDEGREGLILELEEARESEASISLRGSCFCLRISSRSLETRI
jgi:hypothetical protein